MSASTSDDNREILPRWRDLRGTLRAGEATPQADSSLAIRPGVDFFAEKELVWKQEHSLSSACDLVGAAIVWGREIAARDAASYILAQHREATPASVAMADRLLGGDDVPSELAVADTGGIIRDLRRSLRFYPHNSLYWVDLARHYVNIGLLRKAMDSMLAATSLAPNNRYVLRAAARLHTHAKDFDGAHDILINSAATPGDPWLMAAEVSTAALAKRSPRYVKAARSMLDSRKFAAFDLGELASALATLDYRSGGLRLSRKFFRLSLRAPSENVIAQARWATTQKIIDVDSRIFLRPGSDEAQAWYHTYESRWGAALEAGRRWLDDQPFSANPCIHASFVALFGLEDFAQGLQIARVGLLANPNEPGVLNNGAVAAANLGNLGLARDYLRRAAKQKDLRAGMGAVLVATGGLIAYRSGDRDEGRRLYKSAIDRARGNPTLVERARLSFALEEIRSDPAELDTQGLYSPEGEAADSSLVLLRERLAKALRERRARV